MNMLVARRAPRTWALPALMLAVLSFAFPHGLAAQDVDLTGKWMLTVESPNGTGERTVTFVQEGAELSGDIASSRAAGPLAGTIDGKDVTFVAMVMMDSGPFEITYTGTVEGDTMFGTVEFGSYGTGTFTGHRVDPDAGTR